jgi:1,2-phenylacetyl-CoA epoxidase catalytic subunit
VAARILPESLETLRARWLQLIGARLAAAHLPVPSDGAQPGADGRTRRTDEFAWLHGEFTTVSGSEAGATW